MPPRCCSNSTRAWLQSSARQRRFGCSWMFSACSWRSSVSARCTSLRVGKTHGTLDLGVWCVRADGEGLQALGLLAFPLPGELPAWSIAAEHSELSAQAHLAQAQATHHAEERWHHFAGRWHCLGVVGGDLGLRLCHIRTFW